MDKCCGTCKFWTKITNYENITNEGVCKGGISQKLTVHVHYGWDGGSIVAYETEEDFCCSIHAQND
jgi:hypothetical protein